MNCLKFLRLTMASHPVEVEEVGLGVQFFLELEDALVLEDLADLAALVQQVAELAGAGWADLHAGGIEALAGALDAEGALLHHALGPGAVAQVVGCLLYTSPSPRDGLL